MNSKTYWIIGKLLEVADLQASQSNSASSAADFDENLFQQFMLKNPVWDFRCISSDEYLQRSKADKEQLLLKYYNNMKMGRQMHEFCLLVRYFTVCFFDFSNCFVSNLPRSLNGILYMFSMVSHIILGKIRSIS